MMYYKLDINSYTIPITGYIARYVAVHTMKTFAWYFPQYDVFYLIDEDGYLGIIEHSSCINKVLEILVDK